MQEKVEIEKHLDATNPRNPLGFYRWNSMWGEEDPVQARTDELEVRPAGSMRTRNAEKEIVSLKREQQGLPMPPAPKTLRAPLPGPPKHPHPDFLPGPPKTTPPASPKASGMAEGARRCIKQADELRRTTNRVHHRTEGQGIRKI